MVTIRSNDGNAFDARVDIEANAVVLHSRSGTSRNRDYRPALEMILARLGDYGVKPDVYLDSNRVDHLPLSQRRILSGAQLTGTVAEQFAQIVRAMNSGRASNGAWSKVRLIAGSQTESELRAMLLGSFSPAIGSASTSNRGERLSNTQQRRVKSADIEAAVADILTGRVTSNFGPSTDYDLLTEQGDRLAPKHVFGRALEIAGVVAEARPVHFSAGWTQPCFPMLEDAGYTIIIKSASAAEVDRRRRRAARSKAETDKAVASVPADPEERRWIEGNPRMAIHLRTERTRSPKAVASKRTAVRAANEGRLACEHCATDWYAVYPPAIAEAIFDIHHTIPLKDMGEEHETGIEDLLCLCANCHRAEHRRMALG
jgi:5-methylcytosine-specific restriction endonuclease McrA